MTYLFGVPYLSSSLSNPPDEPPPPPPPPPPPTCYGITADQVIDRNTTVRVTMFKTTPWTVIYTSNGNDANYWGFTYHTYYDKDNGQPSFVVGSELFFTGTPSNCGFN